MCATAFSYTQCTIMLVHVRVLLTAVSLMLRFDECVATIQCCLCAHCRSVDMLSYVLVFTDTMFSSIGFISPDQKDS
jgi:hypothetical protein